MNQIEKKRETDQEPGLYGDVPGIGCSGLNNCQHQFATRRVNTDSLGTLYLTPWDLAWTLDP